MLDVLGRLLPVAGQKGVHVVRPLGRVHREDVEDEAGKPALDGARLGDRREIRRRRTAVGVGGRLLVGERRREIVVRLARPLEHLALVVRTVLDLVLGRECLDLGIAVAERRQVAEGDQVERMAVRADLRIDLQPALELRLVEGAEGPGERPRQPRRVLERKVRDVGRRRRTGEYGSGKSERQKACN